MIKIAWDKPDWGQISLAALLVLKIGWPILSRTYGFPRESMTIGRQLSTVFHRGLSRQDQQPAEVFCVPHKSSIREGMVLIVLHGNAVQDHVNLRKMPRWSQQLRRLLEECVQQLTESLFQIKDGCTITPSNLCSKLLAGSQSLLSRFLQWFLEHVIMFPDVLQPTWLLKGLVLTSSTVTN